MGFGTWNVKNICTASALKMQQANWRSITDI